MKKKENWLDQYRLNILYWDGIGWIKKVELKKTENWLWSEVGEKKIWINKIELFKVNSEEWRIFPEKTTLKSTSETIYCSSNERSEAFNLNQKFNEDVSSDAVQARFVREELCFTITAYVRVNLKI